jgi:hypothetical protein
MRGHSNSEPSINIVIKFIHMDDNLFEWMKEVKLDEFTRYNLAPTVFGVFGVVNYLVPQLGIFNSIVYRQCKLRFSME